MYITSFLRYYKKVNVTVSFDKVCYERKIKIFHQQNKGRQTAGNVEADRMDLPVCKGLLARHDFLHFDRNGGYGCVFVDRIGI